MLNIKKIQYYFSTIQNDLAVVVFKIRCLFRVLRNYQAGDVHEWVMVCL